MSNVVPHTIAYWGDPSNVIWVDLGHRRLQGFDNYWVASSSYGFWQDTENIGTMYSEIGRHAYAFEWKNGQEIEADTSVIPADAVHYRGFMLTDEQARFVGLI